ncbi:MAG: A24 family peptidase [Proteobacteria bacterium]|nr:A24 family peptidase [Pseudomonadota bacterium]
MPYPVPSLPLPAFPGWFLLDDPIVALIAAAVVGLCVGSFINVVVHRLPKMMQRAWEQQCAELRDDPPSEEPATPYNLVVPRSACPTCQHQITALENIPVVSWLFLRGKCSQCGARISIRYPLVELLGGLLAGLAFWFFGPSWQALAACALLWTLLALTFIDADTQLLPDDLTLPLLWAGLFVNLFGMFTTLPYAVIGAMAGYLSLWLVYWVFKLLRNKEGMGYGDFKLLAALGAWLGWPMLIPIVLLSSLVGALLGLGLILFRGRDHNVPMSFGPFLAIAGAIALFFGSIINRWLLLPL